MNHKQIISGIIGTTLALSPFVALASHGSDDSENEVEVHSSGSVDNRGSSNLRASIKAEARLEDREDRKEDRQGKLEDFGHERGDREIDRRIEALTRLSDRIEKMKRVSDADQASLAAMIDAQIDALLELKAKIAADTSTTTLKADLESITKSHRVFALVMPKAAITAAADRVITVVGQMEALSVKLETRIDAATSTDTSALEDALDDMKDKVADAKVKAQAAISLMADLKPDNGDADVKESNTATLKEARAKVLAAQQDLKAARADVEIIVKGLGWKGGMGKGKKGEHASSTEGHQ